MISEIIPVNLSQTLPNLRVDELKNIIKDAPKNSLLLAPELAFTGYEKGFDDDLAQAALQDILEDKTLVYTRYFEFENSTFNTVFALQKFGATHIRAKSKLFKPSKEESYFRQGEYNSELKFELDGVSIGTLICFELRFSELWARLKGCDIILVPSMWGEARKEHFNALCKALAIVNSCFVAYSSGGGKDELKSAGVYLPNGNHEKSVKFDPKIIAEFKNSLGL